MRLDRRTVRAMAMAAQIGTSIAASIAIGIGGGYLLDRWLHTRPIFTLLGVVIGLVAAGYTIYEMDVQLREHRPGPPES
jgi:ATP synthase protein I